MTFEELSNFTFVTGLVVELVGATVDDNELELVPSERNAESEEAAVVGGFRVIVIGDFEVDEGELFDRRCMIVPLEVIDVFVLFFRMI